MMKVTYFVTLAIGFVTVDGARVTLHPKNDVITKYNVEGWRPDGYSFEFETSSGNSRKERSYLKTDSTGKDSFVTEGVYSYVGDDNQVYKVNFIADKNGYRPTVSKEMTGRTKILPEVVLRIGSDDIVFPEDTDNGYTTRKSILPADSTTTESIFTDEDIFTTTIFPEEGLLENRIDLSDKLIGSLLGGK